MDLTLNIKAYYTKKLLEVNLHDTRKNKNPIGQKTEVYFSRYLTPNKAKSSFSKNLPDNVPVGYHHFLFNF